MLRYECMCCYVCMVCHVCFAWIVQVVCMLRFSKPKYSSYKRPLLLNDYWAFDVYSKILQQTNWYSVLDPDDFDEITENITQTKISAAIQNYSEYKCYHMPERRPVDSQ